MQDSRANERLVPRVLAIAAAVALLMPTAAQITCGVRVCCAPDEMHHTHDPAGDTVGPTLPDDSCTTMSACSISIPGVTLVNVAAVLGVPTAELAPTSAPATLTSQPGSLPTPPPKA
jgi:hypothetical protein